MVLLFMSFAEKRHHREVKCFVDQFLTSELR